MECVFLLVESLCCWMACAGIASRRSVMITVAITLRVMECVLLLVEGLFCWLACRGDRITAERDDYNLKLRNVR